MLQIKNLKSGYGGAEILHGVDMEIRPSEVVAIIGPNGAGKSTVLKSIFNLSDIYSGRVIFEEKEISGMSAYKLIGLGIGYVPQGRQVFSDMTVKENLEMGAFTIRDKEIARKNIKAVLKRFPILDERKNQLAGTLSGGEQQILAIARSLVYDPQLLLLDEPSLGLSPKAMKEIFDIIQRIKEDGVTIIIVEQNARAAVEIADRTYILESGKIALTGGREILKNPKIKEIYFG